MREIIESGKLDGLKSDSDFHELSMSRLGYYGNESLATELFKELKKRGLARESEDGKSIPMHAKVRSLVLVLLSQILRSYGSTMNAELSPVTDRPMVVSALAEMLAQKVCRPPAPLFHSTWLQLAWMSEAFRLTRCCRSGRRT